jgi:PAS domain S-box-containing protein
MPPNSSIPATQTNQQLSTQLLTSLINSIADGVVAVDRSLHILLYNAAALNIFDVNNILVDSSLLDVFHPVDKNNLPFDIAGLISNTTVPIINRDLRLVYQDGSHISLYLNIAPVHLGFGQQGPRGYVVVLRDITREKSLEEERDEFISVVSHELRTPVAIAEGNISNAQLIADQTTGPPEVSQALKQAHSQVIFLSEMINDLTTLSRAERGTLAVEPEAINLHDLLTELQNNYQTQAAAKGLTLKTVIDPKIELLHSSKLYVREILQNFITNAIKYTERGSVSIEAASSPVGVRLIVRDSGIGISKADQTRVFEKFFRSEDYRTRQANGTGLGLYVTAKLARLLHAEISLQSELNTGSAFTIFIPNLTSTPQPATAPAAAPKPAASTTSPASA